MLNLRRQASATAAGRMDPACGRWKRALDVAVAAPTLLILSPFLLLIAVAIKLDSPGPVLFRQERVGLGGARYRMLKFRSMRADTSPQAHAAAAAAWFASPPGEYGYKPLRDPRITRVGRYIRRTSVDEIPQLINVLRGEMSLVGPRPAIPYELEHYRDWYFERLNVRPGMTGLWQVSGRERRTATEMMALDVRYVRQFSLGLDLLLLLLTAPALLGFAPGARLLQER